MISPGLAHSHMVMRNSLGCRVRDLPLVMYASTLAKTPLWGLIDSSQLIPANRRYRPGLEIAQWQIKAGTDELILEVFQESPVESGLLDAIVLSTVLLRSGHSLGGSQAQLVLANPFYSQTVLGLMGSY